MATKWKVDRREYNQWVRFLKKRGYSGPFAGLTINHECVKLLEKELKRGTMPGTRPRDPRTIASNLTRYGRGRKPKRREETEMTSLPEKYLIDHYQKLHKVLEQFYDRLRTPELSELCLFTLKDRVTISRSYVSEMYVPAITYEKGAVKLDVEDSFLWEYLKKHLVTEFPEFSENLGDWKKGIATIVEECRDITNLIADQLAEMRLDSAEPYLSCDSKDYGPGVYYDRLTELIYKCLMADHIPEFPLRVSDSHGLSILVMDYSTGKQGIARGDTSLLNQVEEYCLGIVSDDTIKEKVEQVLGLAKQAEVMLEPIKQNLRLVLERGIFKGTCSVCADLVGQSLEQM
ncbi:hypothetical protein ES708_19113 [subsurface metagenome]